MKTDTWFTNWMTEVQEQIDNWKSQGLILDNLQNLPGESNPTDIVTED